MVTRMSQRDLVRRGVPLQASAVIAQAHYTFGLLDGDEKVREAVGAPFITEAKAALAQLEAAVAARQLAAASATAATRRQDVAVAKGLAWVANMASFTRSALLRGESSIAPEAAHVQLSNRNPGAVALEIERLAKLAQEHLSSYTVVNLNAAMLKQGLDLAREIREADESQELAGKAKRPVAVQRMQELKAVVHVAVRLVHAAAQRVYRGDRAKKAPYTSGLLHRKVGRPPEAPTPDASPPKAVAPPLGEAS